MNNNLKNHYKNVIVYNFLTTSNYQNIFQLPKITKISLNIGFKNATIEKKKLINILIFLKLIINQKPIITKSKKNNLFLKIKKNSIIGCKVTLQKKNIYFFLEKYIFFIKPYLNNKTHTNKNKKKILNFQIKNIFHFIEFKKEFLKFKNIPPIDVSIHTNAQNDKEFYNLLNSFFIL